MKRVKIIILVLILSLLLVSSVIAYLNDSNFKKKIPSNFKEAKIEKVSDKLIIPNEYWKIKKTGIEENLNVSIEIINETTSLVKVGFLDKEKYLSEIKNKGYNLNNSINLLNSKNNLKIPDKLDLSKESEFYISYDKFESGMEFKLGKESVIINSTIDLDSTEGQGKNIYLDINGGLNVVYTSSGSDFGFARSSDNGNTWTSNEILTGTFDDFGITGNSTEGLLVYRTDGSDIDGYFSDDNGVTWSSNFTIMDNTASLTDPFCITGLDDSYHCCSVDSSGNVYYVNSTNWDNEILVLNGGGNSKCSMALEPDDGTVYMAIANNNAGNDNVTLIGNFNEFQLGYSSMIYQGGTGDLPNPVSISLSIQTIDAEEPYDSYNEYVVVFGNDTQTLLCRWYRTWEDGCEMLNGTYKFFPDIAVNSRAEFFVASGNDGSGGGNINITNSSIGGIDWTYSQLDSKADFPSIADQNYPKTAKFNDTIHLVYTNSSGVYYSQFKIFGEEIIQNSNSSCSCPDLDSNWIVNLSDYCIVSEDCVIGKGNLSFIGSGNFTCNSNINISNMNLSYLDLDSKFWIASNCRLYIR